MLLKGGFKGKEAVDGGFAHLPGVRCLAHVIEGQVAAPLGKNQVVIAVDSNQVRNWGLGSPKQLASVLLDLQEVVGFVFCKGGKRLVFDGQECAITGADFPDGVVPRLGYSLDIIDFGTVGQEGGDGVSNGGKDRFIRRGGSAQNDSL